MSLLTRINNFWGKGEYVRTVCITKNWPPQPEAPSQARESQLHLATSHSNRRLEELKWSVLDNLSRLIDQGILVHPHDARTESELNKSVGL